MSNAAGRDALTSTNVRVTGDGRRFAAARWLPGPGASAPAAGWPLVVFGHGFAQTPDRYPTILAGLAARGYAVLAPSSSAHLVPSHARFATELLLTAGWAARTQPVDPRRVVLAGHSMGGGAAILAAGRSALARPRDVDVAAVATLAAARTRPHGISAASGCAIPALFVVGSADRLVPPAVSRELHDAWAGPAAWVELAGGYHCGFVDSSSFRGFGCDSGTLPRSVQLTKTVAAVADWLDATLVG